MLSAALIKMEGGWWARAFLLHLQVLANTNKQTQKEIRRHLGAGKYLNGHHTIVLTGLFGRGRAVCRRLLYPLALLSDVRKPRFYTLKRSFSDRSETEKPSGRPSPQISSD